MKKYGVTIKHVVAFLLVLIAMLTWTWQYNRINLFYDSHTLAETKYCEMGEDIEYKGWKGDIDGYSCTVTGFEIIDADQFYKQYDLAKESVQLESDNKLILVHITLFNRYSKTQSPALSDLSLYGANYNQLMDFELLMQLNPNVDTNMQIMIPEGEKCELVIPFILFENDYKDRTWKNINNYTFFISIPASPLCQYVPLEGKGEK